MEWTKEQKATIETTGKNILVSAAAGSGKTTVLVERIKNLVLNEGADIDRFLITTFTKAAAAEMKERLEKAIRSEMKKPDADRQHLSRQLRLLPSASIGTFHSFAIEIMRQYFYLADLEPGFSVADEIQTALLRREAIDRVFRRRYDEESDEFSRFLLKYSSDRGDSRLKDNIISTYKTLVSIPDYMEWAKEKAELLQKEDPLMDMNGYSTAAAMIIELLGNAAEKYDDGAKAADNPSTPNVFRAAADDAAAVRALEARAKAVLKGTEREVQKAIRKMLAEIGEFSAGKVPYASDKTDEETKKKIQRLRNAGKGKLDKILKEYSEEKLEEYAEDMKAVYADTCYYVGILEEFTAAFRDAKARENIIDFDDIMHYAIEILKDDNAAEELREKYDYIFIDEYQDSNYLQEAIVSRIVREDNLFMVGDVKQCIYRFRLAEPDIFIHKAKQYQQDEEENSLLLNLNSNFRSKSSVTDSVNAVFSRVMEGYDEKSRLNCTAPGEYPGMKTRMHILNSEEYEAGEVKKSEAEAAVTAEIIKERLGQEIYDAKAGCMRQLKFRDFAVISRKNRVVEEIERYLLNEGIPAYGEGGGQYYETVEVQVFLNLLRVIDNMRQDIPLISAMRSAVFAFEPGEMAEIRIAHPKGKFSDAVIDYGLNGENEELKKKVCCMVEALDLWKEMSRTVPLEELMKTVLYDTGYYDYCSGLPVGNQRISNLRLIGEKASAYEKTGHGGLYGFLRYVESMQESGQSDAEAVAAGENDDVVRVMSVHKSKGLEFSVVIFPDACRKTSVPAGGEAISIHRDYGIGLPVVNREEHWHRKTFLQKAIDFAKKNEAIEEEIRILYVAMTRAKDCLEIIGTVKKEEQIPDRISDDRFLDMMYVPLRESGTAETVMHHDVEVKTLKSYEMTRSLAELFEKAEEIRSEGGDANSRRIFEKLSFEYPYREKNVRAKYSVSQLNSGGENREVPLADFRTDREKKSVTAAKEGTLMHLLMEKADFAKAAEGGEAYMQAVADGLLADETITPEEYDAMKPDRAAAFFSTETGKRAADAQKRGKLFREKEFILEKEIEGVPTVVQGIIDCFFEENGSLVLIDYKNSHISPEHSEKDIAADYAEQVSLYTEALEKGTGKHVGESYLYLFEKKIFIKTT